MAAIKFNSNEKDIALKLFLRGFKMGEKLSIKKIHEIHRDEWVLLVNPDISPETKVDGGEVVFHSKDRGEVHRRLSDFKGDKAIVFTGKIPEDVGVLL